MVPSVKRAALGLVKKMIHYIDKDLLQSISLTDIAGTYLPITCINQFCG